MEQITHYSTFLKGLLDASPWIWHAIQGFALIYFIAKNRIQATDFYRPILNLFYFIKEILLVLIIYIYGEISILGFLLLSFTILFESSIFSIFKFKSNSKIHLIWKFFETLFIFITIFTLSNKLNYTIIGLLIYIWGTNLYLAFKVVNNSIKYFRISNIKKYEIHGFDLIYFSPIYILLILLPNSWYVWVLSFLHLFHKDIIIDLYPKYFIKNNSILFDDINKIKIGRFNFFIFLFFMYYFKLSIDSFLLIGFFIYLISTYQNSRRKFANSFEKYLSFSTVTGNNSILEKIVDKDLFLSLLQRINLEKYSILVSPYEKLVVADNKILEVSELTTNSHHLILVDGGEISNKIIRIENDLTYFLGRVDTVIDYFSIANQKIDEYSEPIDIEYANCIRERIAVKQAIIDEKPTELDENPKNIDNSINSFINSINTESVRINMLVQAYFKENAIDYEQLQSELINNGPFEINTLIRQMREGGSIPSRFVDSLSIAEVSARYLFSLVNEVNNYLNKNENSVEDRNKLKQLSFGPCIGFLRSNIIAKKNRDLNEFEKTIKELLEIKYTDSVNFERLKKYLITDLHYDKDVKDDPNLNDLFNYMAHIRNKTRGHGTPSKVEFEFYVTLDLISIFIVNCISKIEVETYSRQIINDKEWLLYYNAGGNVVLNPLDINENLDYWKDSFDWKYLDKMEEAKKQIDETNQSVYFKIKHQEEIHWIKAETYFKCKEGIVYMYDGLNYDEAEWISFTTGAVIRPYRIN
jgi:hypothetical protein